MLSRSRPRSLRAEAAAFTPPGMRTPAESLCGELYHAEGTTSAAAGEYVQPAHQGLQILSQAGADIFDGNCPLLVNDGG